jgi:hypothetical protein
VRGVAGGCIVETSTQVQRFRKQALPARQAPAVVETGCARAQHGVEQAVGQGRALVAVLG